ncbi:hypothetical protein [Cribrihabitans pelagius]
MLGRIQSGAVNSPTRGVIEIIDRAGVAAGLTAKAVLKQTYASFRFW